MFKAKSLSVKRRAPTAERIRPEMVLKVERIVLTNMTIGNCVVVPLGVGTVMGLFVEILEWIRAKIGTGLVTSTRGTFLD